MNSLQYFNGFFLRRKFYIRSRFHFQPAIMEKKNQKVLFIFGIV